MNTPEIDYLLTCLAEEASEIVQEACKAIRFGLRDDYKGSTPEQRLSQELNEFRAVVASLQTAGVKIFASLDKIVAKQEKIKRLRAESERKRTLGRMLDSL